MRRLVVLLLSVAVCFAAPVFSLERESRADYERPATILFPQNAPYSPQKAALGKMLFFDPRLSGAQNMSCATCHNPSFGWETPVPLAIGALNQPLGRHTPTIENLAEANNLHWDGQFATLEEQAVEPFVRPMVMNAERTEVVARLAKISTYVRLFDVAFPGEGLTTDTLISAIATYERTLRSGWSPFDDWVRGDETAISEAAKRGFDLFVGQAHCAECHQGWAFTDHGFHANGITTHDADRVISDLGIQQRFKTPGLRNIALRAPYMHNGSIGTLREVIEHYVAGAPGNALRDDAIEPLTLGESDIDDLLAFLTSLTARDPHIRAPALPAE